MKEIDLAPLVTCLVLAPPTAARAQNSAKDTRTAPPERTA